MGLARYMGLRRGGGASLVICAEAGVIHVPSPVVAFVRVCLDVDCQGFVRNGGSGEFLVRDG